MGKKARKTRWRTLDIVDDHSDSEESNTNSLNNNRLHNNNNNNNNNYRTNGYHSKYSYSSQSTPSRRILFQYDGSTKSTRSSSTTSENKITFNEDEYTRITTPRQDVLFKKGYLNKPKTYQTQTSTGNSTISTGYSTENGTPDHQSTSDLDYESQFVFPNGFVDQNGIYYVNSFEPYPLMLFNPPTYYQEFSNNKSKRYSTESLSEPLSPNNEECTSQDMSQSGGEASSSNCVSDCSGGQAVYNLVYSNGYYANSASPTTDFSDHHQQPAPSGTTETVTKKLKKRRERHPSKTVPSCGDSSENTDENLSDDNNIHEKITPPPPTQQQKPSASTVPPPPPSSLFSSLLCSSSSTSPINNTESQNFPIMESCLNNNNKIGKVNNNDNESGTVDNISKDDNKTDQTLIHESTSPPPSSKQSILKPEAEEFIPRIFHQQQQQQSHIKMLPAPPPPPPPHNFIPIPLVPISDIGGGNFNPPPHAAFIPPGFPINFIPHPGPVSGFVNFTTTTAAAAAVAAAHVQTATATMPLQHDNKSIEEVVNNNNYVDEDENENDDDEDNRTVVVYNNNNNEEEQLAVMSINDKKQQQQQQVVLQPLLPAPTVAVNQIKDPAKPAAPVPVAATQNKTLDIATVVSKLTEEAVKQHRSYDSSRISTESMHTKRNINNNTHNNNNNKESPKYNNKPMILKRNFINKDKRFERVSCQNGGGAVQTTVIETAPSVKQNNIDNRIHHTNNNNNSSELQNTRKTWNSNTYQKNHYQQKHLINNNNNNSKTVTNDNNRRNINNNDNNRSKNYSDMLKRVKSNELPTSQYSAVSTSTDQSKSITQKSLVSQKVNATTTTTTTNKQIPKPNQWISVSSRKKKKNRNIEFEDDDIDDNEILALNHNDDVTPIEEESIFESYDVEKLIDVVIPVPKHEQEIETESLSKQKQKQQQQQQEIERKIEPMPTVVVTEEKMSKIELAAPAAVVSKEIEKIEDLKTIITKKSKKTQAKKVMITDIDQSGFGNNDKQSFETQSSSSSLTSKKIPVKKNEIFKPLASINGISVVKQQQTLNSKTNETVITTSDKKSKKKKKKMTKLTQNEQQNNDNCGTSIATATPTMGSTRTTTTYDFLLDKTLSSIEKETSEKTNDEIFLELDKLIQKGMYNPLQEKIKSVNIEADIDGFFQTIDPSVSAVAAAAAVPGNEKLIASTSTSVNGLTKSTDFNRIFQGSGGSALLQSSTRQFLKSNMVSLEPDNTDIKVVDVVDDKCNKNSSFNPDTAYTIDGPVLEDDENKMEIHMIPNTNDDKLVVVVVKKENEDEKEEDEEKKVEVNEELKLDNKNNDKQNPHALTAVVMEWLNKTRENTPEVEIFKSPLAIKEEFSLNNNNNNNNDDGDDDDGEITLFSTNQSELFNGDQMDFLDFWDNESIMENNDTEQQFELPNNNNNNNDTDKYIKCNDEIIEIYESKYGKNEAFLNIQNEINEQKMNTKKEQQIPPALRNLPHRAVCCSLQ